MSASEIMDRMIQAKVLYKQLSIEHWVKYEVFTWQWWIGVACVILPLLVWWKLTDKRRILTITAFGFMVNILATFLDVIGSELLLWNYNIRTLPQIPLLLPVDFIIVPVVYMLIYQHYKAWKPFLFASIIVALVLSFIAEPLAVYIQQYQLISWHYIYSFPIYILIVILSKLYADKLLSIQEMQE